MTSLKIGFNLSLMLLPFTPSALFADIPPPLQLANHYKVQSNLNEYWVSEKLDGMRAYWDGSQLWTRGGHLIHAPDWFTEPFPKEPLDGELWAGRGNFSLVSSIARTQKPDHERWRKLQYKVFDLPESLNTFNNRLVLLQRLLQQSSARHISPVKQFKVKSQQELQQQLDQVIAKNGEGLMLHRGRSLYQAIRNNDLLKLKPYHDAEAEVIAWLPGSGKYAGLLGAIRVRTKHGKEFKIGSGFTFLERKNPPPIGSIITYRYRGLTKNNIPRFATYLRMRLTGE